MAKGSGGMAGLLAGRRYSAADRAALQWENTVRLITDAGPTAVLLVRPNIVALERKRRVAGLSQSEKVKLSMLRDLAKIARAQPAPKRFANGG